MPVMRQDFVERRARGHARVLQLDGHQRQAVDEADQIRPTGVERARDNELRSGSNQSLVKVNTMSVTKRR